MILLDLFCGRWGWSRAFAKRGWHCIGVDLTEPPEIPDGCDFIGTDVLNIGCEQGHWFSTVDGCGLVKFNEGIDAIVASPPCEQFSVHGMKNFHPDPPYPELGIKLFNHTRQLCEASGVPYVMENVKTSQRFIGTAAHHCGPFYLWGSGVPPLLPRGITKGQRFRGAPGAYMEKRPADISVKEWRNRYQQEAERQAGGRANCANHAATIPPELANTVAEFMERLIELRDSRGVQAGYASLSEEQQNTPPHEKHSQYSGNPGNGPVIDLAGGASRFTTTSRSHAEPRGLD